MKVSLCSVVDNGFSGGVGDGAGVVFGEPGLTDGVGCNFLRGGSDDVQGLGCLNLGPGC